MKLQQEHSYFLQELLALTTELGIKKTDPVANHRMREKLRMEQLPYVELKDYLVSVGVVRKAMGKGGRVALTDSGLKYAEGNPIAKRSHIDDIKAHFFEYCEIDGNTLVNCFGMSPSEVPFKLESLKKEVGSKARLDIVEGNLVLRLADADSSGSSLSDEIGDGNFNFKWENDDERIAAMRLVEVFRGRKQELVEFAGDYGRLVRNILRHETGSDRGGRVLDLASALVTKYGTDLLSNGDLRERLCQIAKIPTAERITAWHPGSISARRLTEKLGFPQTFAGEPEIRQVPRLHFPQRTQLQPLRDFQVYALNTMFDITSLKGGRGILRMPTGTGKTRTAMSMIHKWFSSQIDRGHKKSVCIWVAHTEELCEQAVDQIEEIYNAGVNVSYPLDVYRMWGRYVGANGQIASDPEFDRIMDPNIPGCFFVITNNLILNKMFVRQDDHDWVRTMVLGAKNLLVIDEAHRACAPTYEDAIKSLESMDGDIAVIGLTATPKRSAGAKNESEETQALHDLFSNRIIDPFEKEENPKKYLVDSQILACPKFDLVETDYEVTIDEDYLSLLEDADGLDPALAKNIDEELAKKVSKIKRRLPIMHKLKEIAELANSRTLYFGPTVEDADIVAWRLKSWGISAASVDAKTKAGTRRRIIKDFKEGKIKVLCNCQLLTTGFDVPEVTHVVIGRPTVSTVLYEQMIGRGLRGPQFGGTPFCSIVNVHDELRPSVSSVLAYERVMVEWSAIDGRPTTQLAIASQSQPSATVYEAHSKNESFWQKITGGLKADRPQGVDTVDLSVPRKLIEIRDFRGAFHHFEKNYRGVKSDSVDLFYLWGRAAINMNEMHRAKACLRALEELGHVDYVTKLKSEMQRLNRAA